MNEKLLKANGKIVRHEGISYRVIAQTLGPWVLAQAEQIGTNNRLNLVKGRSALVRELRDSIEKGLVS
jgi:hypothetical protein